MAGVGPPDPSRTLPGGPDDCVGPFRGPTGAEVEMASGNSGRCGVELVDCHSHTYLSGHGEGTVEELVASAEGKGISTLAVTEHMSLPASVDPDCGFSMPEDEVPGYFEAIRRADAAHPGIEVLPGYECDWRPDCEDYITDRIGDAVVLLGSVHMLADGFCFDNASCLDGWKERGVDAVWGEYFELWLDACGSRVPFTTMSHPDLPKKFGYRPSPSFRLKSRYQDAAGLAEEKDRMVEVNTSGWRKDVGEQYPSVEFLHEFCRAGVDCTVGADAHSPDDVGSRIEDAYGVMYEAGYRKVTVPTRDGDRRYIEL